MAFKIGIAGTHSTGKTTFLEALFGALTASGKRVGRVSDLGSAAMDAGFPILRDHTFESTLWIMTRGASNELEIALDCDVLLVDRPVPDALGYLWAALEYRNARLPDWQGQMLRDFASAYSLTYDLLLKTELNAVIPIGDGKERDRDLEFRALAAKMVDRVFVEFNLPHRTLNSDNAAECLDFVTTEIAKKSVAG